MNHADFKALTDTPGFSDSAKKKAVDQMLSKLPSSLTGAQWKDVHAVAKATNYRVSDVEAKMVAEAGTGTKVIRWFEGCLDPRKA